MEDSREGQVVRLSPGHPTHHCGPGGRSTGLRGSPAWSVASPPSGQRRRVQWACRRGEGASDGSSLSCPPPPTRACSQVRGKHCCDRGRGRESACPLPLGPASGLTSAPCAPALPAPSYLPGTQPTAPRKWAQGSLPGHGVCRRSPSGRRPQEKARGIQPGDGLPGLDGA